MTESGEEQRWSGETIPMPLRAVAGLAAVAIDEARRLPERVVGLPVLAVSTALQASLKAQQQYAALVARGDQLLGHLRRTPDEPPPWARFDDDPPLAALEVELTDDAVLADELDAEDDLDRMDAGAELTDEVDAGAVLTDEPIVVSTDDVPGEPAGRLGLIVEAERAGEADWPGPAANGAPLAGYDSLSIAQLRARLRRLTEAQLVELVAYERAHEARPPYLTMLENRLGTVRGG